jgi:hypothetical protein
MSMNMTTVVRFSDLAFIEAGMSALKVLATSPLSAQPTTATGAAGESQL